MCLFRKLSKKRKAVSIIQAYQTPQPLIDTGEILSSFRFSWNISGRFSASHRSLGGGALQCEVSRTSWPNAISAHA